MRSTRSQRIATIVLLVAAVALIGGGVLGVMNRFSDSGEQMLRDLRLTALLITTGKGSVEAMIEAEKDAARARVKAEGGKLDAIKAAVAEAETNARAAAENMVTEVDLSTVDTSELVPAVEAMLVAQRALDVQTTKDEAAYIEKMQEIQPTPAPEEDVDASLTEDAGLGEAELELEEAPKVDMSGFVATAEMAALQASVDEAFLNLSAALKGVYPVLDDASLHTLTPTIKNLLYQRGDNFESQYDRLAGFGQSGLGTWVTRFGDDMVTVGVALILVALLVFFGRPLLKSLGLPRLIITVFFMLMCVLAVVYDLSLTVLLSNAVVRMAMNSILVLAMLPGIQCGISLNLGLPLGIIGGLLGGLMCIEFGFQGLWGFLFAIATGCSIAAVIGFGYGHLLNRLKGNEMQVTTYVGFSVVSLMSIAWMLLPFNSPKLRWPLGPGLRVTLRLEGAYKHILNDFLEFRIGGFTVPTGLLLFMALCCVLMWLFSRSKTGVAMQAVGNNPRFAEATGVSVNRMRVIGTVLSTVLGAVGIIVYSQSYGFMQLYSAPRQMGFIAASAILIGGASTSRAKISHVIIGSFLFQGVLTLGMPVANVLVPQSTISETMRILISNGIILYALTKAGGGSRA
jgi:simple sugar transport system permease protein